MFRGIEKRAIFRDDDDRRRLLAILGRRFVEENARCYAWALMPNHVHLVVRAGETPISKLMHRVGTAYAVSFNRRHERVGHLFQNRFKSVRISGDEQLRVAIRYVVRNPLDGGIVDSTQALVQHPWTSLPATLGTGDARFEAVEDVLSGFDRDRDRARRRFLEWVLLDPANPEPRQPWRTVASARSGSSTRQPLRAGAPPSREPEIDAAALSICREFGASVTRLRSGKRDAATTRARAVLAYHATCEMGIAQTQVAAFCGVSDAAISQAVGRGRSLARELQGK